MHGPINIRLRNIVCDGHMDRIYVSHRNAYRNSTMKPVVKWPLEKHSNRWEPDIRQCCQYSHWQWYGRPRFDSDTPRNSCLCQIFKKSGGARPACCSKGTGDYFSEEMGWGQGQQLEHEADNSPSSHDVIKLRLNFHPLSICLWRRFTQAKETFTATLPFSQECRQWRLNCYDLV